MTEGDITMFAMLSGDWYPLHVDREYAAKSWVGERIAHGLLTLSIMSGSLPMAPGDLEAFVGMDRCRFRRPVCIGDTVRSSFKIIHASQREGARNGRLKVAGELRNQRDEVVVEVTLLFDQAVEP